ncbi:MAG: transposase, partial [Clostridiales bacterium]|nr:transposase [Clostridiales bacterium]
DYDKAIWIGKYQNPLPEPAQKKRGRRTRGKIRPLVERLEELKASVCLFVTYLTVPFDNNQAERDLRMVKTKTKVSGCFHSEEGARDYLKIMSYVQSP